MSRLKELRIEKIASALLEAARDARHQDWCATALFTPVAASGSSPVPVFLRAECDCHAADDAMALVVLDACVAAAMPVMVRGVYAKADAFEGALERAMESIETATLRRVEASDKVGAPPEDAR